MVPRAFQVLVNAPGRHRVQRQIVHLGAFDVDLQVPDPAAFLNVAHLQQRSFLAAQTVIKKNSQYHPVAQPFEGRFVWGFEQRFGLVITRASVFPSLLFIFGRFTPCTGLPPAIALLSRR